MTETPANILELINGCCQNKRKCQQEMYYFQHGHVASICYRYVSKKEEVEELINESFIKLFKNIHLFEANKGGNITALLKGWLKRIVANTCIDHLRKKHTFLLTNELSGENDTIEDVQESGLDKISYKEIIEAIKQLSPVYRTIFNLSVLEGYTHEEIAKTLHITVGASKSSLSKAKTNLRKILTSQRMYINHV